MMLLNGLKRFSGAAVCSLTVLILAIRWGGVLPGKAHADVYLHGIGLRSYFDRGFEIKELNLNGLTCSGRILQQDIEPHQFISKLDKVTELEDTGTFGALMAYGWKERKDGYDVCIALKTDNASSSGVQGLFRVPGIADISEWGRTMANAARSDRLPDWGKAVRLSSDVQHCGMTLAGIRYDLLYDRMAENSKMAARRTVEQLAAIGWCGRRIPVKSNNETYVLKKGTREIMMIVTPGDMPRTSDLFLVASGNAGRRDG